ncbi:collagen alpha-1(II) chain-like [Danaus plexippus]|uniref:collagen alpha-1(II) chain-like n=1 Tax=Danaus plexippus TaxID=13037 RepID=UPI002AB011FE|nr:collagen alpha-1(II) chain-like [Danaus plexippus]
MLFGIISLFVIIVSAESWRWPDMAAEDSVRIDSKVAFIDSKSDITKRGDRGNTQADEIPFERPKDTEGFYNRPPDSGRYPVRVEGGNRNQRYESDGTLDSLQFCKCVTMPDCQVQTDTANACGPNKYLCCYNRLNPYQSDYFNEVNGDRPMLLPNREQLSGSFSPRPYADNNILFNSRFEQQNSFQSPFNGAPKPQILVGPNGPTGIIGPQRPKVTNEPSGNIGLDKPVLVGPSGPTGIIGPSNDKTGTNVLISPNGPNRELGQSASAQRGVLVGPGGPTGVIGPIYRQPILIGPGGPTGIIGPRRQGILVGPGGPTGIIGPSRYQYSQGSGLLVGPGGPTGIIGPGRQILVGPGGPTGQIGPRNFGK